MRREGGKGERVRERERERGGGKEVGWSEEDVLLPSCAADLLQEDRQSVRLPCQQN